MEHSTPLNQAYFYEDPLTEMAEVDERLHFIFVRTVNEAKRAYSFVTNPSADPGYRNELIMRYWEILRRGHLLENNATLRAETYIQRPQFADVVEAAATLTIAWLVLIQECGSFRNLDLQASFIQWSNTRINQEKDFRAKLKAMMNGANPSPFAKMPS